MENTVINPPVPFTRKIPNGLYPGRVITIHGYVPHGASRFIIDLRYSDVIALHVNPRFEEKCIVRNHFQGSWGTEERSPNDLGGLARGQPFEMMLLTEASHYKIAIGGRHYTAFQHRLPFQSVDNLQIDGDVQLYRIEFQINYTAPPFPIQKGYPFAVCPSGPPKSPSKNRPVYNPALPLKYPIFDGLAVGSTIIVSGRPTNSPHRFTIDLCSGNSSCNENIAMHFNCRFDERSVVQNSLIGGYWASEERSRVFPFQAAVNFDLVIRVCPNFFETTINGQYFSTFTHRITPTSSIRNIQIAGDVIISFLSIQ